MKATILYKNKYSISYVEFGNQKGFPILIQHGLIASIGDFELFSNLIDLDTHLISIARPGYGESSPYPLKNIAEWGEVVAILVDQLQLSRFDILGMSSGAPYSYSIGYRFPDKARNIFIFSGTPALYDAEVTDHWPYEMKKNASIAEMQILAEQLFFSGLSQTDLAMPDIQDSMMNNCFGPALDLRIRCMDWGFTLSEVHQNVYMQHSRLDEGFITAQMTAKLLPNCIFTKRESAGHFSRQLLDEFIQTIMVEHYSRQESCI
ncbi:MAG TPA: alpha/beta hydrolase [Anaerolineales bacterium]|nr:alpha/beta hydrolase [Anaerolineales bacterium]